MNTEQDEVDVDGTKNGADSTGKVIQARGIFKYCAISGSMTSRMGAGRHLGKLHRAVSLQQHGFLVHTSYIYASDGTPF